MEQGSFEPEKKMRSLSEKNPGINLSNLDTNGDSEREAFRKRLDKTGVTEGMIRTVEALMKQETFPENPMQFVTQFLADVYLETPHTASSPLLLPPPCYCEHCLPTHNTSSNSPTWQEMKAKLAQGRKQGRFSRRESTVLPSLPEDKCSDRVTPGQPVQASRDITPDHADSSDLTMEGKQGFEATSSPQPMCMSPEDISSTGEMTSTTEKDTDNSNSTPVPIPDYLPPNWADASPLVPMVPPPSSMHATTLSTGSELCQEQGFQPGADLCSTQGQEFQPETEQQVFVPSSPLVKDFNSPSIAGPGPGTDGVVLFPPPAIPSGGHSGKSDTILAASIMEKKKLLKKMYYHGQNNQNENQMQQYGGFDSRNYVGPISHPCPPNPQVRPNTDPPAIPMGPPHTMINPTTGSPQYNVAPPPLQYGNYMFANTGGPPGLFSPTATPMLSPHATMT
ncbi:hypothetical protein WDU94_000435, partial [Cyamophila willieti]